MALPTIPSRLPDVRGQWAVRGAAIGLLHCPIWLVLAATSALLPGLTTPLRWCAVLVVGAVPLLWAATESRFELLVKPAWPERLADDPTMAWVMVSIVAGAIAGLTGTSLGAVAHPRNFADSSIFEIVSGGTYTILLVLVPALTGLFLGRLIRSSSMAQE
ncbi:hypothetical protein [Nocardia sp. NPDC059154]|uniref:hypothetical protein n=1 Tax=Nocardia sp. NPDC059154 TaxID=3346744 RepID=UPI0036B30122